MITYRGEQFDGYNKPKRTPGHPDKSHAVLAKEGSTVKSRKQAIAIALSEAGKARRRK